MRDVIVACDFSTREEMVRFLSRFGARKPYLKIGMELFYAEGPDIVRTIKALGHPVFLDLKLHDIPNTVKRTMVALSRLSVDMVNVHAAGTRAMMEAAREGLTAGGAKAVKLIAVTQLTSTGPETMRDELLIHASMDHTVLHYANNAKRAGLSGVVCSPLEVRGVKETCGDSFLTVTPGIRYPSGNVNADDQARVTTPAAARALGADYIVVGRPITSAEDPVAAYERICADFIET
ncbi:MAG: orotidine-5'-phosphate decarboxylase [Clostridia bacterium]|nr:orotidine-5'-phosphate decarboxylase [Clostridia bacterium]